MRKSDALGERHRCRSKLDGEAGIDNDDFAESQRRRARTICEGSIPIPRPTTTLRHHQLYQLTISSSSAKKRLEIISGLIKQQI